MDNLTTISAADFKKIPEKAQGAYIIDVRTQAEYDDHHVKGAALFPVETFSPEEVLASLPSPDADIYVLCKAGGRAKKAAQLLAPCTDNEVCVVEGGTDACVSAGMNIVK